MVSVSSSRRIHWQKGGCQLYICVCVFGVVCHTPNLGGRLASYSVLTKATQSAPRAKEYKVWNPSTSRPVPVQSQALDIPSSVTEVGRRYKVARPLDLWSGERFGRIWWSATSMPTAVCHCSACMVRNCHFYCWFLIYASNGTSQEFGWHAPRSSSS